MHTKQFYEAPEAELLVVNIEERFMFDSDVRTTKQFIEEEDEIF